MWLGVVDAIVFGVVADVCLRVSEYWQRPHV